MIGDIDRALFDYFQSLGLRNEWFDTFTIFIATDFGLFLIVFAVLFVIFHNEKPYQPPSWERLRRRLSEISVILSSAILSWLLVLIFKTLFASPRPFITFTDLSTLLYHGTYDSFPSGHATFFAALGTALYIYHRRIGTIYLIAAFIIGLARVIVGVHFPFDILAGFVLGIFTTAFVYQALRPAVKRLLF